MIRPMFQIPFLAFLILLSHANASAQTGEGKKAKKKKPVPTAVHEEAGGTAIQESPGSRTNKDAAEESREENPVPDNSASARQQFQNNAALLVFPLADFILKYGASWEYSLSPDLHVAGTFATGNQTIGAFSSSTHDSSDVEISGMAAWVSARWFLGNSFNLSGGLGWRRASASAEIRNRSTLAKTTFDWKISSLTLPVAIGNHWQWKNGLSFGIDWLGAQIGFAGDSEVSIESAEVSSGLEEIEKEIEDSGEKVANGVGLTLATVALGWSF